MHEEPTERKQCIPCVGAAGVRRSIGPPSFDGRIPSGRVVFHTI